MVYKRISTKTRHNFVPYNGKIADITHADTNNHTLDLAAALSETRKIIAVGIKANRMAGTGEFKMWPNEGTDAYLSAGYPYGFIIILDGSQRLQYKLTIANDDYDVICVGYIVEA